MKCTARKLWSPATNYHLSLGDYWSSPGRIFHYIDYWIGGFIELGIKAALKRRALISRCVSLTETVWLTFAPFKWPTDVHLVDFQSQRASGIWLVLLCSYVPWRFIHLRERLHGGQGGSGAGAFPSNSGLEAGEFTPDGMSVHHRTTCRHVHSHTYSHLWEI